MAVQIKQATKKKTKTSMNKIPVFYPRNQAAWRKWLEKNHQSTQAVWLVYHAKSSGKKTISWSEAVDVALCYGWIDSKRIKIDEITSHQYFTKRKPGSTWSKINKDKVEVLIEKGLMTPAGHACIKISQENGMWNSLDEIELLMVPQDLEDALNGYEGAAEYFLNLSKSVKKMMLHWITFSKLPETRQKRIDEIAAMAGKGQRLDRFR